MPAVWQRSAGWSCEKALAPGAGPRGKAKMRIIGRCGRVLPSRRAPGIINCRVTRNCVVDRCGPGCLANEQIGIAYEQHIQSQSNSVPWRRALARGCGSRGIFAAGTSRARPAMFGDQRGRPTGQSRRRESRPQSQSRCLRRDLLAGLRNGFCLRLFLHDGQRTGSGGFEGRLARRRPSRAKNRRGPAGPVRGAARCSCFCSIARRRSFKTGHSARPGLMG